MTEQVEKTTPDRPTWRERVAGALKNWRESVRYARRRTAVRWRNWWLRKRKTRFDYVVLTIGGALPERAAPRRGFLERRLPLPPPPLSMQDVNARLRAITDAENVNGVVLVFTGFSAGMATLQNVRRAIERTRQAGKEVVVYTPYLDRSHYYVACAADRIIAPPSAEFDTLGLYVSVLHYKEALDRVGVSADVLRVSPYKTAGNAVAEATMTPEEREQVDWLLDDRYQQLIEAIAHGRGLAPSVVRGAIDGAPYGAEAARERGLIDEVAYDDALPAILGRAKTQSENDEAKLALYNRARKRLIRKARRRTREAIGVVTLEGLIVRGSGGGGLPLPGLNRTVIAERPALRLLRSIESRNDLSALVVHIDSGGGDAYASDVIARELTRIRQKMPVLVYMGNVAASGGYYIGAAGDRIWCQPMTTTGSIGVILGRLSTTDLYERVGVSHTGVQRGANAGLFAEPGPLTDAQRELLEERINDTYGRFKQVVADGRSMPFDALEPLCGGRVWTGRQAQKHGLVDGFGDFVDALSEARAMAELPVDDAIDVPVWTFYGRSSGYTLPETFEERGASDSAESLITLLTRIMGAEFELLASSRPLALMPFRLSER